MVFLFPHLVFKTQPPALRTARRLYIYSLILRLYPIQRRLRAHLPDLQDLYLKACAYGLPTKKKTHESFRCGLRFLLTNFQRIIWSIRGPNVRYSIARPSRNVKPTANTL